MIRARSPLPAPFEKPCRPGCWRFSHGRAAPRACQSNGTQGALRPSGRCFPPWLPLFPSLVSWSPLPCLKLRFLAANVKFRRSEALPSIAGEGCRGQLPVDHQPRAELWAGPPLGWPPHTLCQGVRRLSGVESYRPPSVPAQHDRQGSAARREGARPSRRELAPHVGAVRTRETREPFGVGDLGPTRSRV